MSNQTSIRTPGYMFLNPDADRRAKQQEDEDRKWAMAGTTEEQIMKRKHLNDAQAARYGRDAAQHNATNDGMNSMNMASAFQNLGGNLGGYGGYGQTPNISMYGNGQYIGGTQQSPLRNLLDT